MPQYKQTKVIRQHCLFYKNAYLLLSILIERILARTTIRLMLLRNLITIRQFCKLSMMKQPKTANGSFISLSASTKQSRKPTKKNSNSE